jgi:hypothetical protein
MRHDLTRLEEPLALLDEPLTGVEDASGHDRSCSQASGEVATSPLVVAPFRAMTRRHDLSSLVLVLIV